jgi:hypothetical protein
VDTEQSIAKPGTHPLMILWLVLSVFSTIGLAMQEDIGPFLGMLGGLFTLLALIGLILSATTAGKVGPVLFIVGCVFFVPLGLIGVFGARKALENYQRLLMLEEEGDSPSEQNKWDRLNDL